jgi:tetratricopeptide (TPR) repeat protein
MQPAQRVIMQLGVVMACLAAVPYSIRAQNAASQDPVSRVRTALGHGDVAGARRAAAVEGTPGQLGLALVEIFEGKYDEARARLQPMAERNATGDAAVELGLLLLSRGQREEASRWLTPASSVRQFEGPDDYLRLARAARGIREFQLANDAFQRVAGVPRADIQTARGELYLLFHQPGDAVTDFRKALEADARWIPAHLGMARALARDEPDTAAAALEAARKLAPAHPDVLFMTAEEQLEAKEYAAAVETLDAMAAVRPATVDEAALRAAVAYADDRPADIEPAIQRATSIDTRSALALRYVGQAAASAYRFDDAAAYARRAVEVDPDDPDAHADLGLYLLRTGDEADARTALEWAWSLDKSNVVTKNMLDMLDRVEQFTVIEKDNLVFKFAPDEADVLAPYAIPLAEQAYTEFVERYGFTPEGPILIEVFSQHDDFAVRTLGLPGLVGALGACFGRVVTMDSPRARPPGTFSWQATLWHEMAHVFTLQLSDYRVPRWLTEGVSAYEEHRKQPAWGRELTLEFANLLAKDETFGVKKLPDAFKNPHTLALAYFEASLLVEHLVAENGEPGLRRLIAAYAEGQEDAEAFTAAFGRSVDEVETSFARFIAERYADLERAMGDPARRVAPDDLPALGARAQAAPGNFVSQFAYGAALFQAGELDRARPVLERAAELAPPASGGSSPRALLGQIAEKAGDNERARREYRALLEHDHANVAAARRLAALADAASARDDLRYALRLVADVDPFDSDSHSRLGKLLMADGDTAAALTEFEVALALGPANPAEAHTDAAEALLKLNRRAEAKQQVMKALSIAYSYDRAQELLVRIGGGHE